jgi:hypothetical protein
LAHGALVQGAVPIGLAQTVLRKKGYNVSQEEGFHSFVGRRVDPESRRRVDFEKPGFHRLVNNDVEAKKFEAACCFGHGSQEGE